MNSLGEKSNIKIFTIRDKKNIVDIISKLGRLEHIEIFKIIRSDTTFYTENINGIFINFNILKPATIEKINTFVTFSKKKKLELQIKEKKILDIKNKELIKLNNNLKKDKEKTFKKLKKLDTLPNNNNNNNDLDSVFSDFSSDEEAHNISLKKKKVRYHGIKAKLIKSSKDSTLYNNKKSLKDLENKLLTVDLISKKIKNLNKK